MELAQDCVDHIKHLYNVPDEMKDPDVVWSVFELLRELRELTDNFASFLSGGTTIKIPNEKQRKLDMELNK